MSAQSLLQILRTGGALRYRPPHGFYVVLAGKSTPVTESEARAAVTSKTVVPNGKDQHGVYLFTLNAKAAHAVPAVQRHPQALPKRPAGVPNALPDLHPLRGTLDSKTSAAVPADAGAAPGPVPAGAAGVDGAGARRGGASQDGQGGCLGCGACTGVTA